MHANCQRVQIIVILAKAKQQITNSFIHKGTFILFPFRVLGGSKSNGRKTIYLLFIDSISTDAVFQFSSSVRLCASTLLQSPIQLFIAEFSFSTQQQKIPCYCCSGGRVVERLLMHFLLYLQTIYLFHCIAVAIDGCSKQSRSFV